MRVAVRVDASSQIGTGHFMRCLTLADALNQRGARIRFVSRHMPDHLRDMLNTKGYEFALLKGISNEVSDDNYYACWLGVSQNQDAAETWQALSDQTWDWLVVDHYALNANWETVLRNVAKRIFVIDDIADRQHDCDMLLDQNLYADMNTRYKGKVPPHCRLMLGPRFALLREEFRSAREQVKPRTGLVKRVLIFFGGVDADNNTERAMEAMVNIANPDVQVDVVIGGQHPYRIQIGTECLKQGFVCHVQTERMAELMVATDLAIGAGGISTYERLYLRLPSLLKPISLNQVEPLNYMEKIGLFELFSTQKELENKLKKIIEHGIISPPDCVSNGKNKLVECMITEFTQLCVPRPLDVRRTYRWLQDKKLREDFVMAESPRRSEHCKYWRKLYNDSEQRVYSILHFGKHVGNCGLKNINSQNCTSEIWIYLGDLSARGRGVAKYAISKLLSIARNDLFGVSVCLHVAKSNYSAIHLYKNNGFYEIQSPLTGRWSGRDSEILRMECIL